MNYKLKYAIIRSNKNQIQIAREAEIQESKLSKIVNRYIQPSIIEKKRIAKVLNVSAKDIFNSK